MPGDDGDSGVRNEEFQEVQLINSKLAKASLLAWLCQLAGYGLILVLDMAEEKQIILKH